MTNFNLVLKCSHTAERQDKTLTDEFDHHLIKDACYIEPQRTDSLLKRLSEKKSSSCSWSTNYRRGLLQKAAEFIF